MKTEEMSSDSEVNPRLPARRLAIYRRLPQSSSKCEGQATERPTSAGVDKAKPSSVRQLKRFFDNGVVSSRADEYNSKLNDARYHKHGISRRQSLVMKEGFVLDKRIMFEATLAPIDNSSRKGRDGLNRLAMATKSRQKVTANINLKNEEVAAKQTFITSLPSLPASSRTGDVNDFPVTDVKSTDNFKITPIDVSNCESQSTCALSEDEPEIYANQSDICDTLNHIRVADGDTCVYDQIGESNSEISEPNTGSSSHSLEKSPTDQEHYLNQQSNEPASVKPLRSRNSLSSTVQYDSATGSELSHVIDSESIDNNSDASYDSFSDSFSSCSEDDTFDMVEDLYENQAELNLIPPTLDSRTSSAEYESGTVGKLYHNISEFISTERRYLQRLHLIDQEFQQVLRMRNQKENIISEEALQKICSNINSIYLLHNYIFKQLEKCDVPSESNTENRIGLVLKRNAPYLKLYSIYMCNFEEAQKTLEFWKAKSSKFANFIKEIESKPICDGLKLTHHMLEPIQRRTRYELLLKDYLEYLPQDSLDRADAEEAYELVTASSKHSEEVMKRNDNDMKMLQIAHSISCSENLLSPSRQLVKEGKVVVLSKRAGERKERYLYLFNDLLLICRSTMGINLKPQYRVTCKLSIDGLKIIKNKNVNGAFYLMGREEVVELCFSPQENADAWLAAFDSTIESYEKSATCRQEKMIASLGSVAPLWIKDHQTDTCMLCGHEFNPLSRRKHHCRACGIIVCRECSSNSLKLAYSEQQMRVCATCFTKLNHKTSLIMDSSEDSLISGYLRISRDNRTWSQHWFALTQTALFSFESKMVKLSTTALRLDGYRVGKYLDDSEMIFCLSKSAPDTYYFKADDEQDFNKWMRKLRSLTNDGISTSSEEWFDATASDEFSDRLKIRSDSVEN